MKTQTCEQVYAGLTSEQEAGLVRCVWQEVDCCGERGVALPMLVEDYGVEVLAVVWEMLKSRSIRGLVVSAPTTAAADMGITLGALYAGSIEKVGETVTNIAPALED